MGKLRVPRKRVVQCSRCGTRFQFMSLNKSQHTVRCPACKKICTVKFRMRSVPRY